MERRAAKDIFGDAVELPTGARTAYIVSQCGSDAPLRAEVEKLLASHSRAGEFLADPTVVGVAAGGNGGHEPPDGGGVEIPEERPGDRIGPYKLLEQLAVGGFGVVFVAQQDRPVARRVALKVIKAGMDTRQVVARFEQERQALALMDHPNIARVFDAGATGRGRPYFVMELVKGEPITTYCDKNHLAIRERLALFGQVCRAVQHAHTKGIIHRDLTPNNILVITQDGRPLAKVIDFGIAKATGARLTEKTIFTGSGQLVGTLEYMSPEQAAAEMDIDTRSDVYSLGVLLYELLTGLLPFDSKVLRSAAFAEIQRIIRDIEPEKPSTRLSNAETLANAAAMRHTDPSTLTRGLRGDLDWIVMKALDKERERRYETADAFCADIERFLRHEAVLAGPPSQLYRLGKLVRRHRVAVAGAAVVILALGGGAVALGYGLVKAQQGREAAERSARMYKRLQKFYLEDLLGSADVYGEGRALNLSVLQSIAIASKRADALQEPDERAALEYTIGSIYLAAEMLGEAQTHLERSLALRKEIGEPAEAEAAESMLKLSTVLDRSHKYEQALQQVKAARVIRVKLFGESSREVAEADYQQAEVLGTAGRREEALSTIQQAAATLARLEPEGRESGLHSWVLTAQGRHLVNAGKAEEAIPLLRRAVGIWRRLSTPAGAGIAVSLTWLTNALVKTSELEEARKVGQEALEYRQATLIPGHPMIAQSQQALGVRAFNDKNFPEAERLLREALKTYQAWYPWPHGFVAVAQQSLAAALMIQGTPEKLEEAFALCADAIRALETLQVMGATVERNDQLANVRGQLGRCLMLQGHFDEAKQALDKAWDVLDRPGQTSERKSSVIRTFIELYQPKRLSNPEELAKWTKRLKELDARK